MKKTTVFIFLISILFSGKSVEFSDSLISSVLTVSPGNELYSTFGHTAIRVKDLQNGYDFVFNYGTFDFNTSNFYLKFAFGKLDYMLSVEPFDDFMEACKSEQRSVQEQVLNFDKTQNIILIQLLITNYKPENRYYRYKFFTDNCSTRIRDIIVFAAADNSLLSAPHVDADSTFRYLYTKYLNTMPWSRFGIDMVLGIPADKKAGYDALFLPDDLQKSIALATNETTKKILVKTQNTLLKCTPVAIHVSFFSPIVMMLIILLSALLIQLKKNWSRIYDWCFFLIFGLVGLFIGTLSVFSGHAELHYNLVVLFLLPTNIFLPFVKSVSLRKYYLLIASGTLILGLILLPLLPQKFNPAFVILIIAIGFRYFFNIINLKK